MNRASGSTCSRSPGMQKKRQRSSKPSGAPSSCSIDLRQARQRQEVGERAVGLLDRQPQHLAAQRREDDRHRLGGGCSSLKPVGGPLAGERRAQEVDRLRDLRQRALERDPVPALDDPVRRGADPEREAPAAGVGERRRLLGEQRRPAREDADDAGAEARALGPRGRQRQRREAVGAVGLAAPEVGVAGRLGAADEVAVVAQRQSRQRQRQAPALAACARDPIRSCRAAARIAAGSDRLAPHGLLAARPQPGRCWGGSPRAC